MHPDVHPDALDRAVGADALDELIRREAMSIAFQPIVDLNSATIAGYEALCRPAPDAGFSGPVPLFDAAERHGRLEAVEAIARRLAITATAEAQPDALLFLNNSPPVFIDDAFADTIQGELATAGLSSRRVVLEITERVTHGLADRLTLRTLDLRQTGFHLALDDVGAGISGLNQIMALRPDWMKLDMELVSNIDLDPLKQNLIRFFVHFAKLGNMRLVAEGIEREDELRVLVDLGVSHGQGFLLGRPAPGFARLTKDVESLLVELHHRAEARRIHDPANVRVSALMDPPMCGDVAEAVAAVRDRRPAAGVVVLDRRRYLGWTDARALDGADGALALGAVDLEPAPLVAAECTLSEALEMLATRPDDATHLPLVVQRRGAVVGVVSVRQVLQAAAESHRRAPSHIAPLTGLPSRVQADRWLARHIASRDPADIAFIDLRDFDAYNVAYGYERGDEMLMRVVSNIRSVIAERQVDATLFAHLGGDRFLLALPPGSEGTLHAILDVFEAAQHEFFTALDVATESFRMDGPSGSGQIFPLTSLRIIHLPGVLQQVGEPRDVHFIAARLSLRGLDEQDPGARRRLVTDRRHRAEDGRASA